MQEHFMGCTAQIQCAAVQKFALLHYVQIGSGAQPSFYPMGTRGLFPGDKAAGA
jgi:hypothetical protein